MRAPPSPVPCALVRPVTRPAVAVAGAATGIAINLMSADKADLPLHGSNGYSYALSSTADNTLDFYAQYKSTNKDAKAGPAKSVANFSIVYN